MVARILTMAACLVSISLTAQSIDQYAQDCNTFSFTLQKIATPAEENAVFAPYSIYSCLSMVYAGAKNETAEQIQKALSLRSNAVETAHAAYALRSSLIVPPREGCGLHFTSANGLFADQDTFILSSFRDLVQKNYQAELASLKFSQTDKAILTINGWVSNETKGKIPNLLHSGDVDASTRLVLVNAASFQGKWLRPFDPKVTEERPFHVTDTNDVQVPMMEMTDNFYYHATDEAQILSLPFQTCDADDPRITCMIVLPKSTADRETLDSQLSSAKLREWSDALGMNKVNVQLPRFCMKKRLDLNSALSQLGMADAFTDKADFSAIDGMHDLFLSKVVHEAYFSLNEYGVEAAAGTSAMINVTAMPQKNPPIPFIADHPFYFFLIDGKTQTILFAGKLFKPDEKTCL